MKTFWTPWRIDHVLGKAPTVEHCIFEPPCKDPSSPKDLLLYKNQDGVILLNRFPYANGHLLVAPKRHIGCLTDLTEKENCDLMLLIQQSTKILKKHLSPDGFNIGCNIGKTAGAGIADHLHFHIVPRWDGDHNFMTVISDIRTIPEHIERTFENLAPDFTSLYLRKNP